MPGFYEFFAGGGMARAGLGPGWTCLFANDFDPAKARAYRDNWGDAGELRLADVRDLTTGDLPGRADLVWASFPCQDLSLAGPQAGLDGARSGAFHPFWQLVRGLVDEGRAPRIVALENVCGALTSHGGADFAAICAAYHDAGFAVGALVIDAALFVPQSRPRLFFIGVRRGAATDRFLVGRAPDGPFHPAALVRAVQAAPGLAARNHLWWRTPIPARRNLALADVIETAPAAARWRDADETRRLLGLMSETNLTKVRAACADGGRRVGAVYRRTRRDGAGRMVQRAEVRFDDLAGCLRTPAGGSSRQTIVVVEGEHIRSRLLTARETARLMGLGDEYRLPETYNDAYRLTADGVVVDVVRHLARHLIEPLLGAGAREEAAA